MRKPNNYDSLSIGGFTPVALGGHICVIKKVQEEDDNGNKITNSYGNPMIIISIDFDDSDTQPRYFSKLFADDIRPDKKWPIGGRIYITYEDDKGNATPAIKRFHSAWTKSTGKEIRWGDNYADQFTGTKIGAVYGEKENEYNGKITMQHKHRYWCSIDEALKADIPKPIYLNGTQASQVQPGAQTDVFAPVEDDELPFN